jgi:hypothetical protein
MVKLLSADGTARETEWKSRTLLGQIKLSLLLSFIYFLQEISIGFLDPFKSLNIIAISLMIEANFKKVC